MIIKRFIFYFLVSSLTHTVGITGFWLVGFLPNIIVIPENLPEMSEDLEIVPLAIFNSSKSEPLKPLVRFTPTYLACRPGYVQGYEAYNGQRLSEGIEIFETIREARQEYKGVIKKAVRIIERVPNYKNRYGNLGERIVILNPPNEKGEESVSIYWYDQGVSYSFINAPTLKLALEFERANAYAY